LDAQTREVDFTAANAVNVYKLSMVGLGNYLRGTGYPAGDVTGVWETLTLTQDRGRAFLMDNMDNEETLGLSFGKLGAEFVRTQVVPEIDAVRFSKWASAVGISEIGSPADLSGAAATVLAAFDIAMGELDANDVPSEGRKLFIVGKLYNLLKGSVSRVLANETSADRRLFTLDGVEVIPVPQTRFYKGITMVTGAGQSAQGGYAKTGSTGRDINFILMHPSAVLQATKLAQLKIFTPDENQTADAYLVQYRLYHDAWVLANKAKGIYSHIFTS
jgi:hypothetical protein